MSEVRIDNTENRIAQPASEIGQGRHRGPAAADSDVPGHDVGRGRHRRPTTEAASSAQ